MTDDARRAVRIVRAGLMTTVQDLGRLGLQSRGVPPAGPMDPASHRLANVLVGNRPDAATLEVTLLGPEILFTCDARVAVCGAEFTVTAGGTPVPRNTAVDVKSGVALRFGPRARGARAYLAIDGGLAVAPVLGSRATHVVSRMGGVDGRRLQDGDEIVLGDRPMRRTAPRATAVDLPSGGAVLRVLMGPHTQAFSESAVGTFVEATFAVANESDRMAYRLNGPQIVSSAGEMISDVLPTGGIQVPGSGQPILLMADRATTGGYPIIATVITADLPVAGQLAPGDWIRFSPCTRAQAMTALIARERGLMD
jgi:antagonist of KipI